MPSRRTETPYDEDIANAIAQIREPTHTNSSPFAALAQANALISIAKTLRRLELRLPTGGS